jgi:serine/threonine protein kinase
MTVAAPAGGVERMRRIQHLFDEALETDEDRRGAFVAAACGEDLELRAEVEALLASLGRARTREILPPLLAEDAAWETEAPDPATSLVGLRVHNYQVDAVIGSGGMAEVYVAHHLVFPRKAALKVLRERFSRDADIVQRLINEARAANAIHHPSIIEVIDAGRLEGSGTPYILMEYLDGESLGSRLRAGRLPIRDAVRITIKTAEAVAAAHDKGIVHRDLKPENIFLVRRVGARPLVKVLDFGIAKLRSDVASTLAQTKVGAILGTPQYMSPEQCRDSSTVDHRTDIYSLGVILYERACGRPPFQVAAGFTDVMFAHVALAPLAPRKLVADLPVALESVILRCLAKSPHERYRSMRDLVDRLRADGLTDHQ